MTGTVVSQLSVAVTVGAAGTALQATVTEEGTPARVGWEVSTTIITWEPVRMLLQLSVAVQVRVRV